MKILIVVEGGVVQEVRGSTGEAIDVEILDLDSDEMDGDDRDRVVKESNEKYPYVLLFLL